MEYNAKNIVKFASVKNATRVKEAIFSLLNNKLGLALSARKESIAKSAFTGPKNDKNDN